MVIKKQKKITTMKKHLQLLLAFTFLISLPFAHGQEKSEGKIKVEISKEVNGEKKTFKGEYENEAQMKADPNYQEFAGESGTNFWFDHDEDLHLKMDQLHNQTKSFLKLNYGDDDDEANVFFKHLGGDSSGAFSFHHFSDEEGQAQLKDLHFEIEAILENIQDGGGKSIFAFSSKKVKVVDVTGDEFGTKGEVAKSNQLTVEDLSFFPNPAPNGQFKVRFSVPEEKELSLKIFNLEGKEVYNRYFERFGGTYSESIDLSDQEEGIYLLEISQGAKRLTKKIVIN